MAFSEVFSSLTKCLRSGNKKKTFCCCLGKDNENDGIAYDNTHVNVTFICCHSVEACEERPTSYLPAVEDNITKLTELIGSSFPMKETSV